MSDFSYEDKKVVVTGGASFIGSHLVEELVKKGSKVKVVDNLSSGKLSNLSKVKRSIELLVGDLRDQAIGRLFDPFGINIVEDRVEVQFSGSVDIPELEGMPVDLQTVTFSKKELVKAILDTGTLLT